MATRVTWGTSSPASSSASAWANTSAGVPSMRIWADFKTKIRPAFRAISSMLWLTRITVVRRLRWKSRMLAIRFSRPAGSRPAVGSSSTSTSGSMASTPARAARRFCPPESSKGDFIS